jgi:uncharacterized protein with PIN domain
MYDEDEEYADDDYDKPRCRYCGLELIKSYEEDDAYGTSIRYPVWYCPKCG